MMCSAKLKSVPKEVVIDLLALDSPPYPLKEVNLTMDYNLLFFLLQALGGQL